MTTKHIIRSLLALSGLLLSLASPLSAQMNYQGRLTDSNGAPITGNQATVRFSLYDSETAGTKVWGDFDVNADLLEGRFNVVIGPNDSTGSSINEVFTQQLYLQITLFDDQDPPQPILPALPRQQILNAPYALGANNANHAKSADTAANFTSLVLKTDEDNQRVGIGTPTPSAKLEVVGDTKLTGSAQIVNNLTVGGSSTMGDTTVNGNLSVEGSQFRLGVGTATSFFTPFSPGGGKSGLILESGIEEGAGMFFNGDTAALWSAGDAGLFNIYDEDQFGGGAPLPQFSVSNTNIFFDRYSDGGTDNKMHNAVGSLREEVLRIVRGEVNATGDSSGVGWTATRSSTGTYLITFSPAFRGIPTVTATPVIANVGGRQDNIINLYGITNFVAGIAVGDGGGAAAEDQGFNFIAIGPR